jgi:hypothetical protein
MAVSALEASPAVAATTAPASAPTTQVPCTAGGVSTVCSLQVTSLQVVNGVLQANGTVTHGTTVAPFAAVPVAAPTATPAAAVSCPVLALTLGPLHLDLLGLVVDLNQVVLNINAVPGAGNLLGNLLCDVTNLLNTNPLSPVISQLLSQINTILAGL